MKHRIQAPPQLIMAFMAGLSIAAHVSASLYIDQLVSFLATENAKGRA